MTAIDVGFPEGVELDERFEADPHVVSIETTPREPDPGERVNVEITVENQGDAAHWQSITVSFPDFDDEFEAQLEIEDHDLDRINTNAAGHELGAEYGSETVIADHLLLEGDVVSWEDELWRGGEERTLEFSFVPTKEGEFRVKSVAQRDGVWTADPIPEPASPPRAVTVDQQHESAYQVTLFDPPAATFEVVTTDPVVDEHVEFDPDISAFDIPIETVEFDFTGDGEYREVDGSMIVRNVYEDSGEYEVTMRVTDELDNVDTHSENVTVIEPAEPSASVDKTTDAIERGETVAFDASNSTTPDGEIVEYRWDFTGDGEFETAGETPEYDFDVVPGEYDVVLEIEDEFGQTAQTTATIAVSGDIHVSTDGTQDFTAIQSAIDATDPAFVDTVEVHSGTYEESVHLNREVDLVGIDTGDGQPLIDADGFDTGLTVGVASARIEGLTIEGASTRGLDIGGEERVAIHETHLRDNDQGGISVSGDTANHEFVNNTFEGDRLRLTTSTDHTIIGNTFEDAGLRLGGGSIGHEVVNNTVNDDPLIYHEGASGKTIDEPAGQVVVVDSTDVTIRDQEIDEVNVPIVLRETTQSAVLDNVVRGEFHAIDIRGEANTIGDNEVTGTDRRAGIRVIGDETTLADNLIQETAGIGVYVDGSNASVESTTIRDARVGGLDVAGEDGIIRETRVVNASNRALNIRWDNQTVADTTIDGADIGLNIGADGSTISNISVNNTQTAGINARGDNLTITNGTVESPGERGVHLEGTNNEIDDAAVKGGNQGIVILGDRTQVKDVDVTESETTGITLSGDHNAVANSAVGEVDGTGISLSHGTDNRIANNTVTAVSDTGIDVGTDRGVRIEHNDVSGADRGVALGDPWHSFEEGNITVTGNVIHENEAYGIVIEGIPDATIYDNIFNNTANYNISDAAAQWNVSPREEENVVGGPTVGGNFWAHPEEAGFSEMAAPDRYDAFAADAYELEDGQVDEYSLAPAHIEPDVAHYANDEDVVETDGLREAVDDWRGGEIDTNVLRDVVDAWRSGNPVG